MRFDWLLGGTRPSTRFSGWLRPSWRRGGPLLCKKTQELKDKLREFDDENQFLAAPNQQVLLSLAQEDRWTMRFSFVLSIACLFVLGITGRVEVAKGQVSASGCEDGQVITRMANAKTLAPRMRLRDCRKITFTI